MSHILLISVFSTAHALVHPPPQMARQAGVDPAEDMDDETRWNGWILNALEGVLNTSDAHAGTSTSTMCPLPAYLPRVDSWPRFEPHTATCPSLFVAVMSRRDGTAARSKIRKMWQNAPKRWGKLEAKFTICQHAGQDEQHDVAARLADEGSQHGDLMLLDYAEGYSDGRLTIKVKLAMQRFLQHEGFDLFMKTDDDTFIAPGRLCRFMSAQAAGSKNFVNSYIGVFAEAGNPVCRDPSSAWYEPNYDKKNWPATAFGGPGYMLSRVTVQRLFADGVPDRHTISSEDRAVAVWVDDLNTGGYATEILRLPGTNGYLRFDPHICMSGRWGVFPYVLHHSLDGDEIACLHQIDLREDPSALVDGCFAKRPSAKLHIDVDHDVERIWRSRKYRAIARTADGFKNAVSFNETSDEYVLACMGVH